LSGRAVAALHRRDEDVELFAIEAALTAGRPVAADVPGVGPAADGRQRDTEVAGRLGAREDEPALVAWECGSCRHVSLFGARLQEVERGAALWTGPGGGQPTTCRQRLEKESSMVEWAHR